MSVRNIITGRQIMESRAQRNEQFGFYFARAARQIRYHYSAEDGGIRIDYMPNAIAEQYGVDLEHCAHSSMLFDVDGFKFNKRTSRIIADEMFNQECCVLVQSINGEILVQRTQVYLSQWSCNTYRYVSESEGTTAVFHAPKSVIKQVLGNIPQLVLHDYHIYENENARMTYGPTPQLRGYHGPDRSTELLRDSSVSWFVGIEVEKEDLAVRNRCAFANCDLGNGWIAEGDGSLDRNTGVEVVSPVLNLLDTAGLFAEYDRLDWVMNAAHSKRCGGHITISRKDMSTDELVTKLMPFIPLLFSLYEGRLTNGYSGVQNKRDIEHGSRRAINRKRGGAVEIRIFSAVPSLEGMKFRTKLVQWIARAIDSGKFTTYSDVAEAMFSDKKLFKLLKSQYDNTKLRRKQALVYLFAGCLEDVSARNFLKQNEHDRMIERIRSAYNSMSVYVRREVVGKFGNMTIDKSIA
jgi:hypothetical protein